MVQLAKGVRDFAPNEKIARNYLVSTLKTIFENYGFNPLETPIIERLETLAAKTGGGEEIMKEVFQFNDQGKRELGLRFDLTVPMSRFVAMNPNLKMPFKRYQIGRVFRDGPIKLGRYREFWQCDVDTIGSKDMRADAEIITLTQEAFSKLGLDVTILINNRKLLNAIVQKAGISAELSGTVMLSLDKFEKIGKQGVKEDLLNKGFDSKEIDEVLKLLEVKGNNKEKLDYYSKLIKDNQGLKELKELFVLINDSNTKFTPGLARGLNYYTGTVFEVIFNDSKIMKFSLGGGGRFDKIIGNYAENNKEYPATGISFGLEPILETLKLIKKIELKDSVVKLFIIPIGDIAKQAFEIAKKIRSAGINTDIDIMGRNISKNMKYADTMKIPFVLIIGENELKENKFKLKNMESGDEEVLGVEGVIEKLK